MPRPSRSNLGLFVVGLGTIAAPLDTAVNIAFPSITQAFALEVEDIRWVVIAYVLTYASLMLVFGKLGDLLGYRRIFQLGLLVSAAGFAACSLAPTYPLLLLGRILQGIGIALTLSCAPALATSLFDERERTRVLGTYAAITAAGSALGPLVGGFLVERWDWNAVFWFRAPLVLVALALSGLIPRAPKRGSARGFDAVGAVLLVTWMSALLLAFSVPAKRFGVALPLGLALLALVGFTAFMIREARYPEPIIRPALFRDIDFTIMNAASVAVHLAAFSVLLLVPYYLLRMAGLDVAVGGIVLAIGAAARLSAPGSRAGSRRARGLAGWRSRGRARHRRALGGIGMDACNGARRHGPVAARPRHRRGAVPGRLRRSRDRDPTNRGPRRRRQPYHRHPHHRHRRRRDRPVGGRSPLRGGGPVARGRARRMPSSPASNRPSSMPPWGLRSFLALSLLRPRVWLWGD